LLYVFILHCSGMFTHLNRGVANSKNVQFLCTKLGPLTKDVSLDVWNRMFDNAIADECAQSDMLWEPLTTDVNTDEDKPR